MASYSTAEAKRCLTCSTPHLPQYPAPHPPSWTYVALSDTSHVFLLSMDGQPMLPQVRVGPMLHYPALHPSSAVPAVQGLQYSAVPQPQYHSQCTLLHNVESTFSWAGTQEDPVWQLGSLTSHATHSLYSRTASPTSLYAKLTALWVLTLLHPAFRPASCPITH